MSFFNFSESFFRSPLRESQSASDLARSPSSPFCTSPSQLQEVTLDQDGSFSNTMRSPTGPMRGRTVKEFEEQLTTLKKENFNLKLRIYFLEEKMGTNFTLDKDNVVKRNIELQVEIANLQKEAKEKHDLLCQAVKAMELEEEEHRKYSQKKDQELEMLQQEMADLKLQMQVSASKRDSDQIASTFDRSEMLRFQIDALQKECESKERSVATLNRDLSSANERLIEFARQIKDYEEKIERAHLNQESMVAKMHEQQKTMDRLCGQLEAANQRHIAAKAELEEERRERERDRKASDRNHAALAARLDALHADNKRQKEAARELQSRLETAANEAKKNQNLAVPQDRDRSPRPSTDRHFISVPDAAAPDGAAKAHSPHVQVTGARSPAPVTPDGRALVAFEQLLSVEAAGGSSPALLAEFAALKADYNAQRQKIVKLKGEQLKACEIIKSMIEFRNRSNDEMARLKLAKEALERELEGVVSKPANEVRPDRLEIVEDEEEAVSTPPCETSTMSTSKLDSMEIAEQYKLLTEELEAKVEVLVATLKEKDSQMQAVRNQYDEILATLEEKENRIVDLEFELLSNQNSGRVDRSLLEKGDGASEKHSSFYKHELDEKEREIDRLNVELKKCTCYLQEIVNKELWDKNKEIEKLHRKQEVPEMARLRRELSGKDLQLKLLKEKISELGLDIDLPNAKEDATQSPKRHLEHIKVLQEQLRGAKEEKRFLEERVQEAESLHEAFEKLKIENYTVRDELEKCERLRNETNEVCSILSARLEELAIFLDSLLKQKAVLGFLGLAKNKRLREIINNSLDMSRSFSMSLVGNPEQSLAQLSNITAFLNGSVFQELSLADVEPETNLSIVPDNVSLTYESHLWRKSGPRQEEPDSERVISALREQVFNLKSELRLRDTELSRLNGKGTETDEETARVGTKAAANREQEAHSESEAWSEPDRDVSRARIGLNQSLPVSAKLSNESTEDDEFVLDNNITPSKKRSSVIELSQDVCRLEKELDRRSAEAEENNRLFDQKMSELETELHDTKQRLIEAQNAKADVQRKADDLEKMVEDLTAYKAHCETNLVGKDKEAQETINRLEVERQSLLARSQELERKLHDSTNELLVAQDRFSAAQKDFEARELALKHEYEETLVYKLKQAEEVFVKQVRGVEEKCEAEIKITQENLRLVKEEYAKDYVKKSDVEKKLAEVEGFVQELKQLKTVVRSYEETIYSYKEKEKEVNSVVQQYQDKMSGLRAELDKTALQYSEAALEKSKLREENQELLQEIEKVSRKEQALRADLVKIQSNLTDVSQKYDQQVSTLHRQKNGLELKISELESANAELHNRLVKTNRLGRPPRGRLPRQYSDDEEARVVRPAAHLQDDADRAAANSSPDLGIESDHGRFSSLETNPNNIPRPLLQTIELTESMNNLFDEHRSDRNISAGGHCCEKLLQVEQENNELKQKMLRMKRALEETAAQLNLANQRKKQVEKTICKQIHKTSQVLRKAKANLDSGSESDVLRT
ncbi:centrosomin-like isoform X2 [Rhynchophorus ferrugineus]|uniref:centrosomin-like isoform X2 n=1 Tax=Rhynchophorus ferrugineus TaxID=354439 RepID=UPI003FCE8B77